MTEDQPVSFDKPGPPPPGPGYGNPPAQGYPPAPGHPPAQGYPPAPGHPPAQGYPPTSGYPASGYPPPYPPYGMPPYGYPVAVPGPPHLKPSSNIGWAIAAIFLFWPLAIPSFIYANKVDTCWFQGNRAGAEQASRDARLWGMIGVIIGAVMFVLVVLWIVFVFAVVAGAVDHLPDPSPYPS